MQKKQQKTKLSVTSKCIIGLACVAVVFILFLLGLHTYQDKWVNFRSERYSYALLYNSTKVKYEEIAVDSQTYMERFVVSTAKEEYYLSVISIDPEVDLSEALEAFQSDGDYTFDVEEKAACGAGAYEAIKISYTDESGTTPAQVSYYYMEEQGLLITTCTDESHRAEIEKMLNSFTIEKNSR